MKVGESHLRRNLISELACLGLRCYANRDWHGVVAARFLGLDQLGFEREGLVGGSCCDPLQNRLHTRVVLLQSGQVPRLRRRVPTGQTGDTRIPTEDIHLNDLRGNLCDMREVEDDGGGDGGDGRD